MASSRTTIVCFGDSNTFGVVPSLARGGGHRFARERRWTGVFRRQLGDEFEVIEEGHPGRTTVHDDPIDGSHKNGRRALPIILESHAPIDLLIIALGVNDLKHRFSVSAQDIVDSVEILISDARASGAGPGGRAPAILLLSPSPARGVGRLSDMMTGSAEKSRALPDLFRDLARRADTLFVDGAALVEVSAVDGIHFDEESHKALGFEVARVVKEYCGLIKSTGKSR